MNDEIRLYVNDAILQYENNSSLVLSSLFGTILGKGERVPKVIDKDRFIITNIFKKYKIKNNEK